MFVHAHLAPQSGARGGARAGPALGPSAGRNGRPQRAARPEGGRRPTLYALLAVTLLALWAAPAGAAPEERPRVWLLEFDGAVGPATADYIVRHLEDAEAAGAKLFVIRMDTPGGLDKSMRTIIKAILDAKIPVATWVAPEGSRAASAGTYILYASHVAAMAPATNLGAATPVQIGGQSPLPGPQPQEEPQRGEEKDSGGDPEPGAEEAPGSQGGDERSAKSDGADETRRGREEGPRGQPEAPAPATAMERKTINDAVAYIRGLAELRGRNADWAERAVRDAASLSASEALEHKVIDLIAADLDALLGQLEGKVRTVGENEVTLHLADASIKRVSPDWRMDFLAFITDPNVAYILLMIGIYGLILEFYNPGLGIPGVTGVICLLLGFYAMQMLPISATGLALILLGVAMMVAEAFTPTFGVLGIGGAVSFIIGSIILMDTDLPAFQISLPIIAAFAVASVGIFIFAIGMALRARRTRIVSGQEAMIGAVATALEDFNGEGRVRLMSESWQAYCDQPIQRGQRVVVERMDGLVLTVRPEGSADAAGAPEPTH